jgi:hypothetical protein
MAIGMEEPTPRPPFGRDGTSKGVDQTASEKWSRRNLSVSASHLQLLHRINSLGQFNPSTAHSDHDRFRPEDPAEVQLCSPFSADPVPPRLIFPFILLGHSNGHDRYIDLPSAEIRHCYSL